MILEGVCVMTTNRYVPQSSRWISQLFIELANENERV